MKRPLKVLSELVPLANVFCYGQVETSYGSGQFGKLIQDKDTGKKRWMAAIRDRESIYEALEDFLGTGVKNEPQRTQRDLANQNSIGRDERR